MTKMSDTYIASVAKQATDAVSIVAMVNVKVSFASRVWALAYRALSLLGLQQSIVCAKLNSVERFQFMIARQSRVLISPFFTGRPHLLKVFAAPFIVARYCAGFAVNAIAVLGSAGLEKLVQCFRGLALRATLEAGRKIECLSWHRSTYSNNLSAMQGAF